MFDAMKKYLELPELYKETEVAFWDDDYISAQMLKAHLAPDFDGASRKLDFIERSVSWISNTVSPEKYPYLLDIGCGPGLYAERFAQCGYKVSGVDFSRRSINYARDSAIKAGLAIDYNRQNYLTLRLEKHFDLATRIYCDYGALSTKNRRVVMHNIYQQLKPGGKLILDVFSMEKYHQFQEQQIWEAYPDGGFWCEEEYLVLNRNYKYSDNVTLEQSIVVSNNTITSYYLWNSCFTRESLTKEAKEAGFEVCGIYGDVAGSGYTEESPTIAVVLKK